jgi:hypothetical protein
LNEIINAIDVEIVKLQQVRAMLAGSSDLVSGLESIAKRGRPKGSVNKPVVPAKTSLKRVLSAAGKARIAAAQKARWAAQKTVKKREKKPAAQAESVE